MRVLIDENTAVQLVGPLKHLLPRHEVVHITDINWSGKKDRPLLRDAGNRGYDVFLTRDSNQLNDLDECRAIKSSGLHHVRYEQRKDGLAGLALALGAIIAAMPAVITELEEADGQRLVHIVSLDPTRKRFESIDPVKTPPRYWPGNPGTSRSRRR
jgi:PIN like domain